MPTKAWSAKREREYAHIKGAQRLVFDFIGPEQLAYKLAETMEAESLLIGRITYESVAGA